MHANTATGFPFRENSKVMSKPMLSYKSADSLSWQALCTAYKSVGLFLIIYKRFMHIWNEVALNLPLCLYMTHHVIKRAARQRKQDEDLSLTESITVINRESSSCYQISREGHDVTLI